MRIKKAKSGEYKKEYPPSLWLVDVCPGDRRGEGFPTLAGFVVKGDALHSAASPCKKKRAVVQCPRPQRVALVFACWLAQGLFRLRVGAFRVLYTVDNGKLVVCVVDAGNRGDVYKRY